MSNRNTPGTQRADARRSLGGVKRPSERGRQPPWFARHALLTLSGDSHRGRSPALGLGHERT